MDLRAQQQQINEAIRVIERLAVGGAGKRRGRPPKWMAAVSGGTAEAVVPRAKRTQSAAARKRIPVIVLDHLTEAQKRAYIIADNQLALNAGWDEALLREELAALQGAHSSRSSASSQPAFKASWLSAMI